MLNLKLGRVFKNSKRKSRNLYWFLANFLTLLSIKYLNRNLSHRVSSYPTDAHIVCNKNDSEEIQSV